MIFSFTTVLTEMAPNFFYCILEVCNFLGYEILQAEFEAFLTKKRINFSKMRE